MAKVQIIGPKPRLTQTLQLLQQLGSIQIEGWSEARRVWQQRMTLSEEPLRLREQLAYAAARVEATLAALPGAEATPSAEYEAYGNHPPAQVLTFIEANLNEISPQVQSLVTRRTQLEEQLASLARYQTTLRQLLPVTPVMLDLERYAVTALWVERRYQPILAALTQQLEELTNGLCEVTSREVGQDLIAAVIIFPKDQATAVSELLGGEHLTQVRLPPDLAGQSLEQALLKIEQRLHDIPLELSQLTGQQHLLAQTWRPRFLAWQAILRDQLAQLDVLTHFGQTDYTFVIEGWTPAAQLAQIEAGLKHNLGEDVLVVTLPLSPAEQEHAPILFNNPRLVKPFEPLVSLLALPPYGDFDPTPLMALFFPLFFGMILGDVAYGLILLLLMVYWHGRLKTRPMLQALNEALLMASIWSIIFGFLFGEFFGTFGEEIGLHPLWFDRSHNVQGLFLLTIGLGAGHVVLGLALGLWAGLRQHNRHVILEKGAMFLALIAIFLVVGTLSDYLPQGFFTPAIALLVIGLAILIYSLGKLGLLLGPLELLSTIGNILSYLRIAAIGLSSVYLAQVANELAGLPGNLLVGLIIAALFHGLNLVLGTFSPTIQSLRLHYVEFFGKFYQGGGTPFKPFQRSYVTRDQ
jgi:V/A-type H+-transporting ATPase subunit I